MRCRLDSVKLWNAFSNSVCESRNASIKRSSIACMRSFRRTSIAFISVRTSVRSCFVAGWLPFSMLFQLNHTSVWKIEHGVTKLARVPPAAAQNQREQARTGHSPRTGLRYLVQFSKQAVRFPVGTRGEKEGVRTSERTAVAEPQPP